MSRTSRSVFAVIDGLLLFLALEGVFYAIAFLGLHRIAAALGGYTTGKGARRSPVAHGIVAGMPLLLLGLYNLHKGDGNRNTPYVLALNLLVPLAFVLAAWIYARRHGLSA